MPLSEQEQRLLDEMERQLLRNDADVVSAPSGARTWSYRNLVYGAVLLIVGIGGLVAGVSVGGMVGIIVGVVGFAAMFAGVMFAISPGRQASPEATHPDRPAPGGRPSQAAFMDRMNERWDRRQDGR